MHNRTSKKSVAALLILASMAYTASALAAEDAFALGAVYGYGDYVNIYGLQAVWAPQKQNAFLARYDLGLRVTGQVSRWVTTVDASPYHSLIDGSVIAELRYSPWPSAAISPFIEAAFGFHLLSNVHIEYRDLATAFNFGSGAAIGFTFGDQGRYEIAALIHHVSNGGIKQPNYGLTYNGIRLRIALE
jgi:hypothetical protein